MFASSPWGLAISSEGARIPRNIRRRQPTFVKHDGQEVWSKMDERLLKKIALATSGAYVPASTRAYDLGRIYDDHLAKLTRGEIEAEKTETLSRTVSVVRRHRAGPAAERNGRSGLPKARSGKPRGAPMSKTGNSNAMHAPDSGKHRVAAAQLWNGTESKSWAAPWLSYTSPRGRRLLPPLPRIVRQLRFPLKHAFRERFGGEGTSDRPFLPGQGRGEGAAEVSGSAPSPQPWAPENSSGVFVLFLCRFIRLCQPSDGLKGQDTKAQGEALGGVGKPNAALKGRHRMRRWILMPPFQGSICCMTPYPGLRPWAAK